MNDWDEDFGQRYSAPLWKEQQDLTDCTGLVNGKPTWKIKVNEDGSFSPVIEDTFASLLTPQDIQLLKGMKVGI